MNKKKLIVISGFVLSLLVIVIVIIMACSKEKITIFFDVDGGSRISSMKVNVGEKIKLPKTTKKGFSFEGWYIADKKIDNKVSFNQDTTLTAHWKENEKETMIISFDSDGGNEIKDMTITCEESFKLPKPKKDGYKFINWFDTKDNIITNKSKLSCENISLKAKWEKEEEIQEEEKKEEPKKEETKKEEVKKEYTCPNGYNLNSDKCIKEEDVKTRCGDGTTEKNGKCINTSSSSRKDPQKTCNNNGVLGGNYCYYDEVVDQETCTQELNSENGKCYSTKEEAKLSCSSGYSFDNDESGCFPISDKEKYCSDGFTLNSDKCIKTIDATLN